MHDALLIVTGVLTTLLAGLMFGFSVAVNGGLRRLKDYEYIAAMQSINTVIVNPLFMLTFMGPVLLLPISAFLARHNSAEFAPLLIAAITYIVGVFGVTSGGNVPLNDKLAKVPVGQASSEILHSSRQAFEKPWNQLHTIRTIAAIVCTVCLFVACLV